MAFGLSAGAVTAIGMGAGALFGGKGSSQSGNATTTQKQEMDPHIASMLFGDGTDASKGLLSQYQGLLGKPQDPSMAQYGQANLDYLKNNGATDLSKIQGAAGSLMGGTAAPTAGPGAWAVGNSVQAPAQNKLDLTGSYDKFINGDAGANPYLTGALQGGVNQSQQAFTRMQDDATKNLQRNLLPSIRSNSILAGQYGGSREGIAEGNALGDFVTQQQRSIADFGQHNTDAILGAQATSFDHGQDRSLAATQGLGAQQYGVAAQDAATKNAAEFTNVGNVQQTTMGNQGAQLQTNQLNQNGTLAGAGLLSGQLAGAAGVGQNQDAYALNQAGKVNGLLAPYLGQVPGSTTTSQPLYQNTGGNVLGGALGGLALGKQLTGMTGNYGNFLANNAGLNLAPNDLLSIM